MTYLFTMDANRKQMNGFCEGMDILLPVASSEGTMNSLIHYYLTRALSYLRGYYDLNCDGPMIS